MPLVRRCDLTSNGMAALAPVENTSVPSVNQSDAEAESPWATMTRLVPPLAAVKPERSVACVRSTLQRWSPSVA